MKPAIDTAVYEQLTPSERVRAAVSATARDDMEELQRLKETCPKYLYKMTDPKYTDAMRHLFSMALAIELEIMSHVLNFYFNVLDHRMGTADAGKSVWIVDPVDSALMGAATIFKAWNLFLEEQGIDPGEFAKTSPPRHPLVQSILQVSEGMTDDEQVERVLAELRTQYAAVA
jgi:hypothetical protein